MSGLTRLGKGDPVTTEGLPLPSVSFHRATTLTACLEVPKWTSATFGMPYGGLQVTASAEYAPQSQALFCTLLHSRSLRGNHPLQCVRILLPWPYRR